MTSVVTALFHQSPFRPQFDRSMSLNATGGGGGEGGEREREGDRATGKKGATSTPD